MKRTSLYKVSVLLDSDSGRHGEANLSFFMIAVPTTERLREVIDWAIKGLEDEPEGDQEDAEQRNTRIIELSHCRELMNIAPPGLLDEGTHKLCFAGTSVGDISIEILEVWEVVSRGSPPSVAIAEAIGEL